IKKLHLVKDFFFCVIEEVRLAYEKIKEVDALDISEEGQELWELTMRRYDERIERVEVCMTTRLRDQLGTAKNAKQCSEYLTICHSILVKKETIDLRKLERVSFSLFQFFKHQNVMTILHYFNVHKKYFFTMIKIYTALLDRNSDWFKNVCETISPEIDKKQKEKNKENVNESRLFLYQSIEKSVNFAKDSPFTPFFDNLLQDSQEMETENSFEKNDLFFPSLFNIIKKRMHLVALWSGLLINKVLPDKNRLSNNYIYKVKNVFMKQKSCHFYLSHLYETLYEYQFNAFFVVLGIFCPESTRVDSTKLIF
ncbi:cytoplasmic dynein 1 heavy chain 1 isoform X2, partial [Brachionus plicatilis]